MNVYSCRDTFNIGVARFDKLFSTNRTMPITSLDVLQSRANV